jgi:hypothetical protein
MDETALSEASAESTHPPDDWSAHDIEEAYQKALRAIEEISGEPALKLRSRPTFPESNRLRNPERRRPLPQTTLVPPRNHNRCALRRGRRPTPVSSGRTSPRNR